MIPRGMMRRRMMARPSLISELQEQVRREKAGKAKMEKFSSSLAGREKALAGKASRAQAKKLPTVLSALREQVRREDARSRKGNEPQMPVKEETFQMAMPSQPKPKQPSGVKAREAALTIQTFPVSDPSARKKRLPHAITGTMAAVAVSLVIAFSLSIVFQTTILFTLGITLPAFVGLAVMFYNYLETTA